MIKYQWENSDKDYAFRRNDKDAFAGNTHIHEYSELAFVRSGALTVFVDGKKHTVPQGFLVYIFPNQPHKYTKRTPCTLSIAVFSNDFLSQFFRTHLNMIPEDPVVDAADCLDLVEQLYTSEAEDITRISGLLLLLFSRLERQTSFVPTSPQNNDVYNAALRYIYDNFKNDITLADMAKALGYHEKYLSHELHTLTKKNFRAFLSSYRIHHAKKLMRSTDLPLSQIAMESGFFAINTFNRVFKEMVGMTPSQYRKNHRERNSIK